MEGVVGLAAVLLWTRERSDDLVELVEGTRPSVEPSNARPFRRNNYDQKLCTGVEQTRQAYPCSKMMGMASSLVDLTWMKCTWRSSSCAYARQERPKRLASELYSACHSATKLCRTSIL